MISRILLLPYDAVLNGKYAVTHLELNKNDKLKLFEISFFQGEVLVVKYFYRDIMIKVIEKKEHFSVLFEENKKSTSKISLNFSKNKIMDSPKKIIEKMLI